MPVVENLQDYPPHIKEPLQAPNIDLYELTLEAGVGGKANRELT